MKRLIASFAALGLVATPALAATTAPAGQAQTTAKPKVHKSSKKAVKMKAAPSSSKGSN